MKKLSQLNGIRQKGGLFGIEIEAEGENLAVLNTINWDTKPDGSLRGIFPTGSAEWVFNAPLSLKGVGEALDEAIEAQKEAKLNFSFRTSVHVHVNVGELTRDQICGMVYTYLLLEEPLINFCGEGRKCNRFCLRLRDSEAIIGEIQRMFAEQDHWWHFRQDAIRYASINLEAMQKFGSIEFRGMRGTLDKDVLMTWCTALNAIKAYGAKHKNPMTIHNRYREIGIRAFLVEVFGGEVADKLTYPDMLRDMAMSFSLSIDIPYCFTPEQEEVKEVNVEKIKGLKADKLIFNDMAVPPGVIRWNVAPQPAAAADQAAVLAGIRRRQQAVLEEAERQEEENEE